MTDFQREEVRQALDNYLKVRERIEAKELGWEALVDVFTEDATYIDPAWGRFVGRAAIIQFQRDSMQGLEDWTFPIEWITIDGNRVIIKFWNRLPGQRPDGTFYEAPGQQVLNYAGNGKFSYDEDLLKEPLIKSFERSLARAISNLRGEGFPLKNRVFQRFLNMVHVMELIQESGWVPGPEVKMPEKVVR